MGLGGTATVADDPLSLSLSPFFLSYYCNLRVLSNWLDNVSVGLQAGKAKKDCHMPDKAQSKRRGPRPARSSRAVRANNPIYCSKQFA